jgi:hypothetical protein
LLGVEAVGKLKQYICILKTGEDSALKLYCQSLCSCNLPTNVFFVQLLCYKKTIGFSTTPMRLKVPKMKNIVKRDDLKDGEVIALLEEHHEERHLYSPPESIHALDQSKFNDPSLVFWSARNEKN